MSEPSLISISRLRRLLQYVGNRVVSRAATSSDLSYPVSFLRKGNETDKVPPGGGGDAFDQPEAVEINHARMRHLASLGLAIDGKRVLDVGCGVGLLAQFFVEKGCQVVCVDGREQNIASLRSRYPGLIAFVADVEVEPLEQFGTFDVVFCYGLLYHLENPLLVLRKLASVCDGVMLLETIICDHALPVIRLDEESAAFNQALHGLGCRPSPSYIAWALHRLGFHFVYAPKCLPDHRDFRFEWRNNLDCWREGHPLRCVFVASRMKLQNSNLIDLVAH